TLAAAGGADGLIYGFGGCGGLSTVEAYNPVTDTWTPRASMPTPRNDLAAAPAADGLIYVFGGLDGNVLATVEAYNPVNDSWTSKADMPTAQADLAGAAGPDGLIYGFGGVDDMGTPLAKAEAFRPAGQRGAG